MKQEKKQKSREQIMHISYIEKDILDSIKNLREPSITQIKRRCGLTIHTIKEACKKLIDDGILRNVEGYRYCLTDKGADFLLRWKPMHFDDAVVMNIAKLVAEQVGKQIKGKRLFVGTGQGSEIKIKTDFTPQVEDETNILDSNIGKLGTKFEKEESQKIEESVKLLKNLKNLEGDKNGK